MLLGNGGTGSGDLLPRHPRAGLDVVLAVLVQLPRDLAQDLRHHLLAEVVGVVRGRLGRPELALRQVELAGCRGDLEQDARGEGPVLPPVRRNARDEFPEQGIERLDPAEDVIRVDRPGPDTAQAQQRRVGRLLSRREAVAHHASESAHQGVQAGWALGGRKRRPGPGVWRIRVTLRHSAILRSVATPPQSPRERRAVWLPKTHTKFWPNGQWCLRA